ncbi:MAG: glycosyltransferase, partial [Chloroflexota bacterium]|nr:glycosyltransferase [Chloroflexota bacterium]
FGVRIGLVTDFYYPWVAGPAPVVRGLGHGLADLGHQTSLLAPSSRGSPSVESDGPLEVTRVRTVPVPFGYGVRACLPTRVVGTWLHEVRPDVVHIHHPFPLSSAALFEARRRGIPVVATNHTIPECILWGIRNRGPLYDIASWSLARWIVFLLQRCQAVATPTATAASMLRDLGYDGVIEAISNGIDTARFSPPDSTEDRTADIRLYLGLDDRPVVLYTGRLDAEKQMDVWLRAAAQASRQVDAQFVVGGRGGEQQKLVSLAGELGIASRVLFPGYLSDDDFPMLYHLADAYMILSPVELQSITTLEAVASGLPVVAVRAGALPELVHHQENGYLVERGDWDAAGMAVAALLQNAAKRRIMGERSRQVGVDHDVRRSVKQYERLLAATAATRGGNQQRERTGAATH